MDCRCNGNARYACRLSILEVSGELEGELEGGSEESLWVEDTKKGLQNIWRILNNFWLVKILYSRFPPSVRLAKIG